MYDGRALVGYGTIQVGEWYSILSEHIDYYKVRVGGKVLCVPKWVFDKD